MSSKPTFIFGTPKGHASTQLLQAMQRGLRAVCTTPSPVRLIASAGQTSAHVGVSQCIHTTGRVCGDAARLTYSKWIIEWPLCVSHSLHASTHDWQPIQRFGSMKKYFSAGMVELQFPIAVLRDEKCNRADRPLFGRVPRIPCTRVFSKSGPAPRLSID